MSSTQIVYHDIEKKMGISAYASPHIDGFAAVSKARFSDFVVHEIALDGTVARLEALPSDDDDMVRKEKCNSNDNYDDQDSRSISISNKKQKLENEENFNVITEYNDTTFSNTESVQMEPINNTLITNNVEKLIKDGMNPLSNLVGEEAARGVMDLIEYWESHKEEKDSDQKPKYFSLPYVDDKEKRKGIHILLKSTLFQPYVLADTFEKRVRVWHILFEKELPNYGKFDSIKNRKNDNHNGTSKNTKQNQSKSDTNNSWPKDLPNYLQFVLYKENIDTSTAVKDVTRRAQLPGKQHQGAKRSQRPATIGYAGMKDKRGVTAQFCTLYRVHPSSLMAVNRNYNSKLKHEENLKNIVTNDDSQQPTEDSESNANDSRDKNNPSGCGNTLTGGAALIRVGHFSYVDKELSLGMLSGNRFDIVLRNVCINKTTSTSMFSNETMNEKQKIIHIEETLTKAVDALKDIGFINYFGMQRFGKFFDTHEVGIAILKKDFAKACDIIMRVKENEGERQKKTRLQWSKRFEGIHIDTVNTEESMFYQRDAEMKCAKAIVKELGRFMNCETSIVSQLCRTPCDYKRAFQSISKTMRSMFIHSYQSYIWNKAASFRIQEGGGMNVCTGDLVLVNGHEVSHDDNVEGKGKSNKTDYSSSGLKGKEVAVVSEADIRDERFTIEDVVLPLVGTKIQYPKNSTGDYYDTLLTQDSLSKADFVSIEDKDLSACGDYRKLICKPKDVDFKVKLYKDPIQPLIQTDLMKVQNVELECIDLDATLADTPDSKQLEQLIVGMIVGFSLPPSAYATIALRELMKRPTAGEYQAQLMLEGDCERNVGKDFK